MFDSQSFIFVYRDAMEECVSLSKELLKN